MFTDHELAEWPALALLVGPHQPTPLRPDQLVMRACVQDEALGTGMVASGYAYPTLAEAIVFGLVAKYRLPGHHRFYALEDCVGIARANLDGRAIAPYVSQDLRYHMSSVVKLVEEHLLDERFLLCLGSEYHDLDLEEDETWAPRQERERKQNAIADLYAKHATVPERWGLDQVGDVFAVPEDHDARDVVNVVENTVMLALDNGWRPEARLAAHVRKAQALLCRPGGVGTDLADAEALYVLLLPALEWWNEYLAPEGHGFEYAYGYLELVRVDHSPPSPGLLIDADGFADKTEFNLELIDFTRLLGRKTATKWRRLLWRGDYASLPENESVPLRQAAKAALDWLAFERIVPDHVYVIDEAGLSLRPIKKGPR